MGLDTNAKGAFKAIIFMNTKDTFDKSSLGLIKRLTSVSIALSAEKSRDRLLELILLEAKSIANADGGTLYYLNDNQQLEFAIIRTDSLNIAYGGSASERPPIAPIHLYDPATGRPNYTTQTVYAVLHKKPINIPDVYDADGFDFQGTKQFDTAYKYHTQSVITIPMVSHRNEVLGCLQLVNALDPETNKIIPFSKEVEQIVQALASQAAVILDNKQLIDAQKQLLESFIEIIAQAIDQKSPYTSAHCERVPVLTKMLAAAGCESNEGIFKDFNLNEEEMYELHIAAWLHDCGKIVTPVHIMDKATKLETIWDRIESVKARFETLKRDAKIDCLQASLSEPVKKAEFEKHYTQKIQQLDEDFEFVRIANIGGEFMEDAKIERLKQIANVQWKCGDKEQPLLSENEVYNLSTRRGTITNEERQIMNDHMVMTVKMLESLPFPKHLERVPEYACGHHERMDGKGYPKAIKAGDMSIPARMMAVADVFEALTAADRPYKPAKKLSEAMSIIRNMKKDHHLDPAMVDLFVKSKIYLRYAEQYLAPELIDAVDEKVILETQPA